MPWSNNPKIDALRRKYNVAFDAHLERTRAIHEAHLRGEKPSDAMIDDETQSRTALNDARAELLAEMTKVITNDGGPQPPGVTAPQ